MDVNYEHNTNWSCNSCCNDIVLFGIAFGEIGAAQTKNATSNSTENASVQTGNISINVIGNLTIIAADNATVNMIFNNLTSIQCD
jgi:hypothetical protein